MDLLEKTLRATALTAGLASLVAAVYAGGATGLAVFAGAAWSLVNLVLLRALVRQLKWRGHDGNPLRAFLLLGVKGPLLYGAGYALLASGLPALGLVAGFSVCFLVATLIALGQWLNAPRVGARTALLFALALGAASIAASPARAQDAASAAAKPAGHETAKAGEHGGEAAAHEGGEHESGAPELPNLVTFIRAAYAGKEEPGWVKFLHEWENVLFSVLAAVILIVIFGNAAKPKALHPGGAQNMAEALFGGLNDFFLGILGPAGKAYVPYVGSLCIYIVTMNWMGMVPFLKSPNTTLNTTFALALCTFIYVQYIGISKNGLLGWLHHFAGQPKDAIGWGTAILLFPLEVMGELIKPISLSCRLFGNILGEDILLAVFVGLGVTVGSLVHSPIGVPLQLPFLVLSMLFGLIQGLVFSLLTTVYIVMMLPHDDHHHEAHTSGAQAAAHH